MVERDKNKSCLYQRFVCDWNQMVEVEINKHFERTIAAASVENRIKQKREITDRN